jgi:hypothetical protein
VRRRWRGGGGGVFGSWSLWTFLGVGYTAVYIWYGTGSVEGGRFKYLLEDVRAYAVARRDEVDLARRQMELGP